MSESQHTSELLSEMATQLGKTTSISLREIVALLQSHGFSLAIFVLCIPNFLPIPNIAGMSAILGIPIIFIGLQMVVGHTHLWLPPSLAERRVTAGWLKTIIEKTVVPALRKFEKHVRPRLHFLSAPNSQKLLGLAFALLAGIMALPIPFMNMLPGIAMALIAIGLIEHDGVIIAAGLLLGLLTVAVIIFAALGAVDLANFLFLRGGPVQIPATVDR